MPRKWKRRGGIKVASDIIWKTLGDKGVLRARDFQSTLNSHNWIEFYGKLWVEEVAPRLHLERVYPALPTELAVHRHRGSVIGLESALWVAKLLPEEPIPVRLVVRRGVRPSRFDNPSIEYHWSNTADPAMARMPVFHYRVPAHSVERALIDILRTRPPELWPMLPLDKLNLERLLQLGSQLRALARLSAWLERQKAAPAAASP